MSKAGVTAACRIGVRPAGPLSKIRIVPPRSTWATSSPGVVKLKSPAAIRGPDRVASVSSTAKEYCGRAAPAGAAAATSTSRHNRMAPIDH
jgi:hypothetical protein